MNTIILFWLSSHVGIRGNEMADRAVKCALTSAMSVAGLPTSDWKQKVIRFVHNKGKRN